MKFLLHVLQVLVVPMLFAKNKMASVLVTVLMNIKEIRMKVADQNVCLTLIVHRISLALTQNVKTFVLAVVV